jgi:hypothetical protein|tara:strand:+ start:11 stop:610 length:600 start_codon:yes stop_codon:yes gene_type:complete
MLYQAKGITQKMNNEPFIKVYDDLIPAYLQDHLELITLGVKSKGEEFIDPSVDFKCKYETTAKETNQPPLSFVHLLKSHTSISKHLENFGMVAQALCNVNDLILQNIMLARVFITMPHQTNLKHYAPHIDLQVEHTVVIYFINDADGDTVFFNNDGKIIKSVEPRKGRAIIFDGKIKHGGGIPKNGPRCIANFDLKIKQ